MEIESPSCGDYASKNFSVLPQPYITLAVIPRGEGLFNEMLITDDVLNYH